MQKHNCIIILLTPLTSYIVIGRETIIIYREHFTQGYACMFHACKVDLYLLRTLLPSMNSLTAWQLFTAFSIELNKSACIVNVLFKVDLIIIITAVL